MRWRVGAVSFGRRLTGETINQWAREYHMTKKCYLEHQDIDGKCYGLVGGDKSTNYLQYSCIGCPNLKLQEEE